MDSSVKRVRSGQLYWSDICTVHYQCEYLSIQYSMGGAMIKSVGARDDDCVSVYMRTYEVVTVYGGPQNCM